MIGAKAGNRSEPPLHPRPLTDSVLLVVAHFELFGWDGKSESIPIRVLLRARNSNLVGDRKNLRRFTIFVSPGIAAGSQRLCSVETTCSVDGARLYETVVIRSAGKGQNGLLPRREH